MPRTDMVSIERAKTLRQALTLALRSRFLAHPGGRRERGRRASASSTSRTSPGRRTSSRRARRPSRSSTADAPRHLRAGLQAGRRSAARDAGGPHPPRHRGRRVRRHRRAGHHRGHPGGDRRRDHRRVRRERAAGRGARRRRGTGSPPGCPSRTSASCSTSELDDEDVETVGGLLAKALGRVPIPGRRQVDVSEDRPTPPDGLRLTAECPAGRRNRIVTVLVEPVREPVRPDGEGRTVRTRAEPSAIDGGAGAQRRYRVAR